MPNTNFIVLINPKSGGNVGAELLSKFHGILDETKVYNLQEGGPRKALEDHCMNDEQIERRCGNDSFRMIVCCHRYHLSQGLVLILRILQVTKTTVR